MLDDGTKDIVSLLATLAAVVAAIAAAWAAYESRRSASAAQAASEGQLVLQFMTEYFDPKMSEALRTVRGCSDAHGEQFAQAWVTAFKSKDANAVDVDRARHHVKSFFDRAVRLLDARLVSAGAFREMAYTNGLNLYYDLIVPLEDASNTTRRKRTEETLMRELGRYKADPPNA